MSPRPGVPDDEPGCNWGCIISLLINVIIIVGALYISSQFWSE